MDDIDISSLTARGNLHGTIPVRAAMSKTSFNFSTAHDHCYEMLTTLREWASGRPRHSSRHLERRTSSFIATSLLWLANIDFNPVALPNCTSSRAVGYITKPAGSWSHTGTLHRLGPAVITSRTRASRFLEEQTASADNRCSSSSADMTGR